jgi:putative ABC transport system substrate-binding protein
MKIIPLLLRSIFASIHIAEAQQRTKLPRMGFLAGTKPAAVAARVAAFQQGLREMGYVEGKNIVVDHRTQKETGSRA